MFVGFPSCVTEPLTKGPPNTVGANVFFIVLEPCEILLLARTLKVPYWKNGSDSFASTENLSASSSLPKINCCGSSSTVCLIDTLIAVSHLSVQSFTSPFLIQSSNWKNSIVLSCVVLGIATKLNCCIRPVIISMDFTSAGH